MFIDGRTMPDNEVLDYDVCIIGSGAAGITIAREIAGGSYSVCLLESGDLYFSEEAHALNDAVNVGRPYPQLPQTRLRMFGGATNHWGGQCWPFDPEVFEPRSWVPYSGWPIRYRDLEPYYRRAHEVIQLGPYNYDAASYAEQLGLPLLPFDSSRIATICSKWNPLRFGITYEDELNRRHGLDVYLNSTVTNINRHRDNNFIESVDIRTFAGNQFHVSSRYFILAIGGIENARLLLLSNNVETNGLGNTYDLVGRFFMEHLTYQSGMILPIDQHAYWLYKERHPLGGDLLLKAYITLPRDVLEHERILQYRTPLHVVDDRRVADSVHSFSYLADHAIAFEEPEAIDYHVSRIMRDPVSVLRGLFGPKQGLLGASDWPIAYGLDNNIETAPNPDSRILLADEKDALGQQKAAVNWRLTELDRATIRRAQELIALEVGRSGFGRMRMEMEDAQDVLLEGTRTHAHHMGTTRMHDNPRLGVTDANCKVHGLENLFVAGSSLFPCSGHANPTLTIVALALRLADHLNELFTASSVSSGSSRS